MDISIIIVNYNVKEFIVPCIKSIIQHSKGEYSYEAFQAIQAAK